MGRLFTLRFAFVNRREHKSLHIHTVGVSSRQAAALRLTAVNCPPPARPALCSDGLQVQVAAAERAVSSHYQPSAGRQHIGSAHTDGALQAGRPGQLLRARRPRHGEDSARGGQQAQALRQEVRLVRHQQGGWLGDTDSDPGMAAKSIGI